MRWVVIGIVSAVCSAASAFVEAGTARATLIVIAALSAICLAWWGANSDRRVEEAHSRILELTKELVKVTATAQAAHEQANRPIWERRNEEFEQLFSKPINDSVRRVWDAVKQFFTATA